MELSDKLATTRSPYEFCEELLSAPATPRVQLSSSLATTRSPYEFCEELMSARAFALRAPPVSESQVSVFGPLGLVFQPDMQVPFSAGLLVATHKSYGCPLYGVLVDVSSDDVMEWVMYILRGPYYCEDKPCQTLREIKQKTFRGARYSFLLTLLVLSRTQTPGQYSWYPFAHCNPCNMSSYTVRTEPLKCSTDGLQELHSSIATTLPVPITLGKEKLPFQPGNGYVLREELEKLPAMRQEACQDMEDIEEPRELGGRAAAAADYNDDDDEASSILLRTNIIGQMPPGRDDIDMTTEDEIIRSDLGKSTQYSFNRMIWSTEFVRRFFACLSISFLERLDFGLPDLLSIHAASSSREGRPALLCTFASASSLVWVSETVLVNVLHLLQTLEKRLLARIRTMPGGQKIRQQNRGNFETAKKCALTYREIIADYKECKGRPQSPLHWTNQEELEATGIPLDPVDRQMVSLDRQLTDARKTLEQRATDEIIEENDTRTMNISTIDAMILERYRMLLSTDPDYAELVTKSKRAKADVARRNEKRQKVQQAKTKIK